MKQFLLFIPLAGLLFFFGLTNKNTGVSNIDKYKNEIIETEKAFSKMSEEKGMAEALLYYSAEEMIRLKDKKLPNMNKDEMRMDFENFKGEWPKLTWEPVKADAAESGDIGYTFGKWTLESKNETGEYEKLYGVYMTVWKRQDDGKWKFVLDGGTTTPSLIN